MDCTVIVLKDECRVETGEIFTSVDSAMIRPRDEALQQAVHFIQKAPEKESEGMITRYRTEVHSADGFRILVYNG